MINFINLIRKKFRKKSKDSYSQKGEDLIVNFIFNVLKIKHPTYIDIGAYDPIKLSNTYLFYQQGSHGICIEPDPELFKKIKKKRRRDICLNMGVGTSLENKKSNFYILSSRVLNTFSKQEADYLEKTTNQKVERIIEIPLLPLTKILQKYFSDKTPNFVSLDTEGYDFKILQSLNLNKFRPEVFCVETLIYTENKDEQKRNEIIKFMIDNNYMIHADTYINTIFVDRNKWINR